MMDKRERQERDGKRTGAPQEDGFGKGKIENRVGGFE